MLLLGFIVRFVIGGERVEVVLWSPRILEDVIIVKRERRRMSRRGRRRGKTRTSDEAFG